MPANSDLRRFADDSLLEQGRRLLERNALVVSSTQAEEDGFLRLRGRSTDPFNFVDHPALLLGPEGKIRDYRCDCGEGRRGSFCAHCAALALKAAEDLPAKTTAHAAAAAPEVKKVRGPAKGEILRYSFSFGNNDRDLYGNDDSDKTVYLDENNFIAMYGNNQWEKDLYDEEKEFGGICYGMAGANSIFNWPQDATPPSDFQKGARRPYDLPLDCTHEEWALALRDYLEMLYISQFHPVAKLMLYGQMNKPVPTTLQELVERVEDYRSGEIPLCILCIFSTETGGHALLPYRVDRDGNGPRRIALYDCNYPGEERYMELLRDPTGQITGWKYEMWADEVWGENRKGCKYFVSYADHELFQNLFAVRPVPVQSTQGMLRTKNQLILRNGENVPVLRISAEEGYQSESPDVIVQYPMTLKKPTPLVHMPGGKYRVEVREVENSEVTVRFSVLNRSAEIRTDAGEFSFEVEEDGQICAVEIPEAERTYYVTLRSTDQQDLPEVRLEGITGYEPLRFGQIRHALYVEGISERTQQDLYLNGQEASLELLKRGFPQEEKQEQKKPERELLFNTAAEDPTGED